MPLHISWQDVLLRLVLTMIAGAMIGFNRGLRGHAAGLRTTILVGLAASVAMIQANVLLSVDGKTSGSFGVMDLMRLPLGILTGVGFIGGGAILRRGDLVTGVTTAATLWMMTVIGLCFGGGQIALGVTATALTFMTLWALKWLDIWIPRETRGILAIKAELESTSVSDILTFLASMGYKAQLRRQSHRDESQPAKLFFEVSWKEPQISHQPFDLLKVVNDRYPVVYFEVTSESRH
ncbi:MAG: MgtC/SapB family protein [Verrucomicrobia bacterium]|nr:MgtC/SapB family protein [Verrucomicrobiota bacterium]